MIRSTTAGMAPSSTLTSSQEALDRACESLVCGDSSTMRVLPYHLPLVADRGEGSRLWDVDGNEFIDLNMAYGPLILGHCPPQVIESVLRQMSEHGSQLGFPTEVSTRVAEKIKMLYPSIDLLRFTSTGTEATTGAVRLARTVTGKPKMIQFEGHYHGSSDTVFNRYHAPLSDLPAKGYGPAIPGTSGINGAPHEVYVVRWNDIDAFLACLEELGDSVAGCIMEPVAGNTGVIPPKPGFLHQLREITLDHDMLMIFDEIITSSRVAPGGAQEYYDVQPDISVVGKAIGGGYPLGCVGASKEIMEVVRDGTLFQGGVYSGNAVVMAAAEAVLDVILAEKEDMYSHLHAVGDQLADGVREIFSRNGIPHVVQNVGPMVSMFLTKEDREGLYEYRDLRKYCDFDKYIAFQHALQRAGIYFHPNQFEPLFLSRAHSRADIDTVLERIDAEVPCCFNKN